MPFIILFLVLPFVELAVFANVSEHIGLWTTLSLALITAIIGGAVVKYQGIQTLFGMRIALEQGQMPLSEIFDGFCLVAAGALLITPGFVTDTIGFALLVPAFRSFLRHIIRNHTQWSVASEQNWNSRNQRREGDIIEGEYEHVDGDNPPSSHPQIDERK